MEHRICDLRNAKFQGQTVNKVPSGFGFLLDENYTFVVGHVNNGYLVGQNVVIFGDSNKICLDMDRPDGLILFTNKYCKIYKNNKALAIDFTASKILIKLEQIKKNPLQQQKRNKVIKHEPRFRVIEQKKYTNQNYPTLLARFLEVRSIQAKQSNYMSFIKQNFKKQYKDLINISQTSKQFALSVRGVGLFIKMIKCQAQNHHFQKISNVGFTSVQKNPQIFRRYSYFRDYTNCIVEQCIQTQPTTSVQFEICQKNCKDITSILGTTYQLQTGKKLDKTDSNLNQKQQGRPKQCIRNLRQYYKRSLTFINKYINLSRIYQLKEYFEEVYQSVNQIDGGKYAQVQIQINGYEVDQYQNPIITKQNQVKPNQATLDDWKKQLNRTLGTRDKSFKKTSSPTDYDQIRRSRSKRSSRAQQPVFSPQKYKKNSYVQRQIQSQKYKPRQIHIQKQKQLQYRKPQRQKRRQYPQQPKQRSKSQRVLKYLDSETEQKSTYTKRSEQTAKYPNLLNSYNRNPQTATNNKSRSPYPYKFKYTQSQKQQQRYNKKPTNGTYIQKRQYIPVQVNMETPYKNIPSNEKSPTKYPKKYLYNNNY